MKDDSLLACAIVAVMGICLAGLVLKFAVSVLQWAVH